MMAPKNANWSMWLAVGICAVGLAGLLIRREPYLQRLVGYDTGDPTGYEVGTPVDDPIRVVAASRPALVVFVRSNCSACWAAGPALKRLVDETRLHRNVPAIAVVPVKSDEEIEYAAGLGIPASAVVAWPTAHVSVVPTALFVDRSGLVRFVLESRPTSTQIDEAIAFLRSTWP